jgi:transposase InsO family protein
MSVSAQNDFLVPFLQQLSEGQSLTRDQLQQRLTYTDDVDLNAKLEAWESFYNYDRPHISLEGKTLYEVMRSLLK